MRRSLLVLGLLGCGARSSGSSSDEPARCAAERCVTPAAVGAWTCGDGSEAGPTGRCIADNGGCAWEVRMCPGEPPPCVPGGCGLQGCVELGGDAPVSCEGREPDECAWYGTCARQPDGACGWTTTAQVRECRKWAQPGER